MAAAADMEDGMKTMEGEDEAGVDDQAILINKTISEVVAAHVLSLSNQMGPQTAFDGRTLAECADLPPESKYRKMHDHMFTRLYEIIYAKFKSTVHMAADVQAAIRRVADTLSSSLVASTTAATTATPITASASASASVSATHTAAHSSAKPK